MDPTPEQQATIDLFLTGDSLAIEAGAGTGKTSTLVMLAKAAGDKREGQYVAFNKALVEDARGKFPLTVGTNTAHSLAFRAVGKNYQHRLNNSMRMQSRDIASRVGIQPFEAYTFDGKPKSLYSGFLGALAMKTVTSFCQSGDWTIGPSHVPYQFGLDRGSMGQLRAYIVPFARIMWADLQTPNGWVPFKHEHYLKMWQLGNPRIYQDFILFDESQDANPVIAAIIAEQANHAQLVYVGDSQQEIYAWTGAVNALANVVVKNRTYLTQSFRFGQAIADKANETLDLLDAKLRLTGNPAIESRIEKIDAPRAVLVRTNSKGIELLLHYQELGRRPHFMGGADTLLTFARATQELMETGRTMHPDLQMFDSWNAVRAYVNDPESQGEDLRLMVNLMDNFTPEAVIAGVSQMPIEEKADITISTAHKAKGREWRSVKLADDFPQSADSQPADLRLLYVATTRAKEVLDITSMSEDYDGEVTTPIVANEPEGRLN